ncbi:MAG TPA: phosphohistidine phosphatase SixA [Verrucomicrobiae bacterium]|nr:phosphohistidine phosphatase SixA [Verrucomicrobiae bacterium]
MKLYLLRHATASDVAPSDEERKLTQEGREEARVAGAALAKMGVKPSYVLSSPLVRARQTAEIAARELEFSKEIELVDELKNNVSTAALLKTLKSCTSDSQILLVGHMPSLSEHVAAFIGSENADGLPLGKGGVAYVELEPLRTGRGQLRWLLRQKQLRYISAQG